MIMNSIQDAQPVAIEVTPGELRSIWNALGLNEKVQEGHVIMELQPSYLERPTTQVFTVKLLNGWRIGVAHRWRKSTSDEWSLPDPKRMWLDDISLYCR